MVSASIAYFAIQLELIRPVIANMPWPSPVGVGAFISTGVTGKQRLSQLSVQFQRLSFTCRLLVPTTRNWWMKNQQLAKKQLEKVFQHNESKIAAGKLPTAFYASSLLSRNILKSSCRAGCVFLNWTKRLVS